MFRIIVKWLLWCWLIGCLGPIIRCRPFGALVWVVSWLVNFLCVFYCAAENYERLAIINTFLYSEGAHQPWIICHDEWRDASVHWILPPCNHRNATYWPWHPNGSTLIPHNRTWTNGSWLCSYYNTSNGMWHVVDCTKNISINPTPHWPRYNNVTTLPNKIDPACIHYLDDNRYSYFTSYLNVIIDCWIVAMAARG